MTGTVSAGTIVYEVDMDTARLLQGRRDVDAALNGLNGSMGRLEASVNRTERSIGSMERTMSSLSGVAKGLLAALSVQQVSAYSDAWTELNNKVANSVKQGETQAEVMQRIFDVSQATQSSLNGTATLYSRLERGTRLYNTSAADLVKLTTIVNQGFAVSGATAQEAENAIIQLSQGIASGVLRGEEFNSISEQGSRLMVALADSMGVSIGQLRAMAAEGKLTTDVVVNGLLSQGDAIGKEFANTTVSISKGLQVAGNNVTKFFGENSTVKSFAAGFRDSVITASESLNALSDALIVVSAVMGSRYAAAITMATAAKLKSTVVTARQSAAERQLAKDEMGAAQAVQRRAIVEQEAAIAERTRAEQTLANLKATNALTVAEVAHAEAEVASIKISLQQIQAEKALEAQRLRAQITEQGRIATATRMAEVRQAEVVLTTRLANAEAVAQGARSAAITAASAQIVTANGAVATSTEAVRAANGRLAASQEVVAATSFTMLGALKSVNAFLLPLGGVAGILLAVAAGWYLYAQNQAQARKENIAFANTLPDVIQKLKEMNLAQAQGVRADTVSSIKAQEEGIANLKEEIADLSNRYKDARVAADNSTKGTWLNNDANEKAAELANQLAKKLRDLDGDKARLQQTQSALHLMNIQVNQGIVDQMRAARDNAVAIAEAEKQASFLGGTQAFLAAKLGQTTEKFKEFNSEALKIDWGGKEGEKLIKQAERRLALSKSEGEARAKLQATYDAEDANVTDPLAIKKLQDSYVATERVTQARKDQNKEDKAAASESKKAANAAESNAQKLAKLRAQSDLTTESVEKRRIQEAGLRAEQSLSSSATQQQLAEAKALGEANERTAISIQKRKEAEQGQKYATQEIASAQSTVNPTTGQAVDPLAQVNLQEQQKLEALAKYQEIDKQNTQLYEDAKTAIQQQAANAREQIAITERQTYQQNMSSLLGATSESVGAVADAIGHAAGKSSAAYLAMFAISKGFAVAQAALNMQTAIGNAMALPWPANIPAIAQAVAAGGQIVSAVSGITYGGGREHGGPVSASSMYRVGEGGKPEIFKASNGSQYMIPGDNGRVISNRDMGGGGGGTFNYSPVINVNGDPTAQQVAMLEAAVKRGAQQGYAMAVSDVASGKGKLSNALTNNFNTSQRLT